MAERVKASAKSSEIDDEHLSCESTKSELDVECRSSISLGKDRALAVVAEQIGESLRMQVLKIEMQNPDYSMYNRNLEIQLWPIEDVYPMVDTYHIRGTSRTLFNISKASLILMLLNSIFISYARFLEFANDSHKEHWIMVEEMSNQIRSYVMFNLSLELTWYDFTKIIFMSLIEYLRWIYCIEGADSMSHTRFYAFGFNELSKKIGESFGCNSNMEDGFLELKNAAGLMFWCYVWVGRLFGTYALMVQRI